MVVEVCSADSAAYKMGLRAGDFIQGVEGKPVRTCGEFIEVMKAAGVKPVTINAVRDKAKLKMMLAR